MSCWTCFFGKQNLIVSLKHTKNEMRWWGILFENDFWSIIRIWFLIFKVRFTICNFRSRLHVLISVFGVQGWTSYPLYARYSRLQSSKPAHRPGSGSHCGCRAKEGRICRLSGEIPLRAALPETTCGTSRGVWSFRSLGPDLWFMVYGLRSRAQVLGLKAQGLEFGVSG